VSFPVSRETFLGRFCGKFFMFHVKQSFSPRICSESHKRKTRERQEKDKQKRSKRKAKEKQKRSKTQAKHKQNTSKREAKGERGGEREREREREGDRDRDRDRGGERMLYPLPYPPRGDCPLPRGGRKFLRNFWRLWAIWGFRCVLIDRRVFQEPPPSVLPLLRDAKPPSFSSFFLCFRLKTVEIFSRWGIIWG